jgi:hypothetical protein
MSKINREMIPWPALIAAAILCDKKEAGFNVP